MSKTIEEIQSIAVNLALNGSYIDCGQQISNTGVILKATQAINQLILQERIDELEQFGETEFECVPMDIIRWKASRITQLKSQLEKSKP